MMETIMPQCNADCVVNIAQPRNFTNSRPAAPKSRIGPNITLMPASERLRRKATADYSVRSRRSNYGTSVHTFDRLLWTRHMLDYLSLFGDRR
jgi:hypothetical protein